MPEVTKIVKVNLKPISNSKLLKFAESSESDGTVELQLKVPIKTETTQGRIFF